MRFVCDSTVGKLAHLLRMCGLDTAYIKDADPAVVISISRREGRVILSRNSLFRELVLADSFLHLTFDDPDEQFRQLVSTLKLTLDESGILTRCLECNQLLLSVEKESIRDRLFEFVAQTQEKFLLCPDCDKIYWHGTHAKAMVNKLQRLKNEPG